MSCHKTQLKGSVCYRLPSPQLPIPHDLAALDRPETFSRADLLSMETKTWGNRKYIKDLKAGVRMTGTNFQTMALSSFLSGSPNVLF